MANNKKGSPGNPGKKDYRIVIAKNGPYLVSGGLPLSKDIIVSDKEGNSEKWAKGEKYPGKETYALCRCGRSKNKPYCDGTHSAAGFECTETASRKKYVEQAEKITGPDLVLTDAQDLCAAARFCHGKLGRVWDLTMNSNDPKSKESAIKEACDCPAGRLVAWDKKTGKAIEPRLEPSISLIEDPKEKVSGPIWVKGGVPIESADGESYETRNRVTLCRCGRSKNKPFCDGCHIEAGFSDGDKSLSK